MSGTTAQATQRQPPVGRGPGMKLSVVIPAHNEEDSLAATVMELASELHAAAIDYEILVINDGSIDRTESVLLELELQIPMLRHITRGPPNGFGLAVICGLENFTGDAVAIYMADASDRPEDLVHFFRVMVDSNVDCVFGSRFSRESRVEGYPPFKLRLNRAANLLIRLLFRLKYDDVTNAFKLYHRDVIEGTRPFLSHHFNLTVEIPLKAIVRDYTYIVVPNDWLGRTQGTSKFAIQEMGSRYLFIVLYCLLEKLLSRGDYKDPRLPVTERGIETNSEVLP